MTAVVFADLVGSTGMFQRHGDETASRFVTQLVLVLGREFRQNNGRVIKILGDGLFVVFDSESDALTACIRIQQQLHEHPVRPGAGAPAAQMQMGIESGEVVEIDGDCFGDTVNSAARLADLAGAEQILTTQSVWAALPAARRSDLRSLGTMHIRGREDPSHVYRVQWQVDRDEDATMMGRSTGRDLGTQVLIMVAGDQSVEVSQSRPMVTIGRGSNAALTLNDPRVSRTHATVEWRGGQFVLTDTSSFGTWVYLGGQANALVLRRTECYLVGTGQISAGCEREANAPVLVFSVK